MGLSETIQTMKEQLQEICRDLDKSTRGNKSAAQRVRTSTVQLAKIAKIYRKESLAAERGSAIKEKKRK